MTAPDMHVGHPDRLLTVHDVMERTRFSRTKTYALMRMGEIPSVLIHGSRRVVESEFNSWLRGLNASSFDPN